MFTFFKNLSTRKITDTDFSIFFRQLSCLLGAGIAITRCCEILENSASQKNLYNLIYFLKKDLLSGLTFSAALKRHRHADALTCQLIKVGEESGKLIFLLNQIAAYKEKQVQLSQKCRQILFYPMMTLLITFIISLIMLCIIIPKFAALFVDMNVKLPFYTAMIFHFSALFRKNFLIIFFLVSGLAAYTYHQQKKHGRLFQLALSFPFLKKIVHKIFLARFANCLAITLSAGLTITHALLLSGNTCPKEIMGKPVQLLITNTAAGIALHQAMLDAKIFPPLMIQMVQIGEESGQLDTMLKNVVSFYEAELAQHSTLLKQAVEPLIMLILGVLIGGLIIAMYLPIFQLGSAFS